MSSATLTPSGKPFRFKVIDGEEIIVYYSTDKDLPQDRFALAITRFVVELVKEEIRSKSPILMGASRDAPPQGSLGYLLKGHGQTPQQLSYLVPILERQGYCWVSKQGRGYMVTYRGGT